LLEATGPYYFTALRNFRSYQTAFTKCTRGWCKMWKDGEIWWENTEHVAYYCSFLLFNWIMNSECIFQDVSEEKKQKLQTPTS
jgi:hypothetical protein